MYKINLLTVLAVVATVFQAQAQWGVSGNAALPTHFLGTTNNNSLIVKTGAGAGLEGFRVRPLSYSTVLMSNEATPIGTWDSDPNRAVIGVSQEIKRTGINYGASIGLYAATSAVNGTSISGTTAAALASSQSWYAAGGLTGVGGSSSVSNMRFSLKAGTSAGGSFNMAFTNATLNAAAGSIAAGVVGTLSGQIASNQNVLIASVVGDDQINSIGTWAGYFKGRGHFSGNVGIATASPTAILHTVGTVRHQNLPSGKGKALVIDANGNVFVSATSLSKVAEDQTQEINELKARLERLEKLLLNQTAAPTAPKVEEQVVLEQNRPNPFHHATIIQYELPAAFTKATLKVADLSGRVVHTEVLTEAKAAIEIKSNTLSDGVYMYSLEVDGKILKTAKMVVSKD